MRRSLSTVAGLAIAGALTGWIAAAPAVAQPATTVPNCSGSFDPYSYTQQAVENCGLQTSTSRAEQFAPDGGSAYVYTFSGGSTATIYQPPAGIDWVNASPTMRADYGIPEEPSASAGIGAVAQWTDVLEHMTNPAPAPAFLAISPNSSAPNISDSSGNNTSDTLNSLNWSGYVAYPGSDVTSVFADYTEPSVTSCASGASSASFWAGIGGLDNSHAADNPDLGQDGTAYGNTGLANGEAWWEIVPKPSGVQSGMVPLNFTIASTLNVYAGVQYSNGTYSGVVDDYSTGDYQPWSHAGAYSGETGEAIAERTEYQNSSGSYLTPLSDFTNLTFSDVQVNNEYMNNYSANGERTGLHMHNANPFTTANELDTPGDVSADGTFTPTWEQCGTTTQVSTG